MTTIETIKAIKDYGTIAICVIGLVWFNNKTNQQEAKSNAYLQMLTT